MLYKRIPAQFEANTVTMKSINAAILLAILLITILLAADILGAADAAAVIESEDRNDSEYDTLCRRLSLIF